MSMNKVIETVHLMQLPDNAVLIGIRLLKLTFQVSGNYCVSEQTDELK